MDKFEFEQQAILAILRSHSGSGPLPDAYFVLECAHRIAEKQEKRRPVPQPNSNSFPPIDLRLIPEDGPKSKNWNLYQHGTAEEQARVIKAINDYVDAKKPKHPFEPFQYTERS